MVMLLSCTVSGIVLYAGAYYSSHDFFPGESICL